MLSYVLISLVAGATVAQETFNAKTLTHRERHFRSSIKHASFMRKKMSPSFEELARNSGSPVRSDLSVQGPLFLECRIYALYVWAVQSYQRIDGKKISWFLSQAFFLIGDSHHLE